jgi:hypothetical protein
MGGIVAQAWPESNWKRLSFTGERDQLACNADLVINQVFAQLLVKPAGTVKDPPSGSVYVKVSSPSSRKQRLSIRLSIQPCL